MSMHSNIERKLREGLTPVHMELVNESHMHNVPNDAESHFKLVLVAQAFDGQRLVQRHQQVYRLLAEELRGSVHALAMHTFSPEEWSQRQHIPASPECMGGE